MLIDLFWHHILPFQRDSARLHLSATLLVDILCYCRGSRDNTSISIMLLILDFWISFLLQALMYPLLVACKSISNLRKAAAQEVVDKVRQHSGVLVDQVWQLSLSSLCLSDSTFFTKRWLYLQAQLVSKELIRVAILWHELWHEALEEASRLYFGEHNIEGMLKVLEPLHEMLEEGAMKNNATIKERVFIEVCIIHLPQLS